MCAAQTTSPSDCLGRPKARPRVILDTAPIPPSITAEMIEAGALILSEYGGLGPYTARHLAEDVYRAMVDHAAASKSEGC